MPWLIFCISKYKEERQKKINKLNCSTHWTYWLLLSRTFFFFGGCFFLRLVLKPNLILPHLSCAVGLGQDKQQLKNLWRKTKKETSENDQIEEVTGEEISKWRPRMTRLLEPLRCLECRIPLLLLLLLHCRLLLIYTGGRPLEMMKTATDTSLEILKQCYIESRESVVFNSLFFLFQGIANLTAMVIESPVILLLEKSMRGLNS